MSKVMKADDDRENNKTKQYGMEVTRQWKTNRRNVACEAKLHVVVKAFIQKLTNLIWKRDVHK